MIAPTNARRIRAHIATNFDEPDDDSSLLTWDYVENRLTHSRNYWLCSVRPDGSPHVRPLWGVYLDGTLYIDGFFKSGWFRNLAADPRVAVHLEDGSDAVILEGHVQVTTSMELAQHIAEAHNLKYGSGTGQAEPGGYALLPDVVFAWRNSNVKDTATKWIFTR
jgi:general stress protein 26